MSQRRPLALLVPLAFVAALLAGCGDDGSEPDANASDTASETSEATTDPTTDASTDPAEPGESVPTSDSEELPDGDDGTGGDGRTEVPADAADLCGAFEKATTAFATSGADNVDDDQPVPPALLEAFREWGRDLADADLPDEFSADQRDGVGVMSDLLVALPDGATGTQLSAFEDALSESDQAKVKTVTDYVSDNCGITGY